jgi:hypothetical protein
VLVTGLDRQITWPSEKGLYFLDTRIISNWVIYPNGELPNGGPITDYSARIFLTNEPILTEDGPIRPRTFGLTISRSISGGLHEHLDITINSTKPVRFQLGPHRTPRPEHHRVGGITTMPSDSVFKPGFSSCRDHPGPRAPCKTVYANGRLSLEVAIHPNQAWHACLLHELAGGEQLFHAPLGTGQSILHSENVAMIEDGRKDRDPQRRVLPSLSPSLGGHGGAPFAYQRNETTRSLYQPRDCRGSSPSSVAIACSFCCRIS